MNTNDDADDKHTLYIYDCMALHNIDTGIQVVEVGVQGK